jgi:hypothetical protein
MKTGNSHRAAWTGARKPDPLPPGIRHAPGGMRLTWSLGSPVALPRTAPKFTADGMRAAGCLHRSRFFAAEPFQSATVSRDGGIWHMSPPVVVIMQLTHAEEREPHRRCPMR